MTRLLYMQKQNYFVVILYKNSFCTPGQFFSFDKIKGLLLYFFFLHNNQFAELSSKHVFLSNHYSKKYDSCYFKKRLWCPFQIISLTFVNYPIKLIKYIHSTLRAIYNLLHLYRAFWMRYSISGASLFWSTYNSKNFQF